MSPRRIEHVAYAVAYMGAAGWTLLDAIKRPGARRSLLRQVDAALADARHHLIIARYAPRPGRHPLTPTGSTA